MVKSLLGALVIVAALAVCAAPALAQPVTPSKSGLVDYVEGSAFLGDKQLESPLTANFPYIEENRVLRTTQGRAETLMNPSLFVRLGENSSLRMVSNRFIDTRVELVAGAAEVELVEAAKDNAFSLVWKGATAEIAKAGAYRFDTDPARIKVFSGLARVKLDEQPLPVEVSSGKMMLLASGKVSVVKFDAKEDLDALDRWSQRRGGVISTANASAARNCSSYGYGYIGNTSAPCMGSWTWNRWFGLWTYIPFGDRICSPWSGYCYYSAPGVWGLYNPRVITAPSYGGGGGYSPIPTAAPTSSGSSGVTASSGAMASAPSSGTGSTAAPAAAATSVGASSTASGGHGR